MQTRLLPWMPMLAAACLFTGFSESATAQTGGQGALNAPTITTAGDGVVRHAADRAFLDVAVETRAKDPREAQAQNAATMTNVQQKLRAANLPKDALRTVGYTVAAEFDFVNGRRVLRDYVAHNAIEVRLDDVNRAGEILDLATTSGATSVGDVRFDLKDREAAEREALALAVADARARADAIAVAAGRSILTIWQIVEEGAPAPRPLALTARAMTASAPETPISSGEIEVRARVTLTVILK